MTRFGVALDPLAVFAKLRWLDGAPLLSRMEPYRQRLFQQAFAREPDGRLRHNLILSGRAKKNFKTTDLILAALCALIGDTASGNQCFVLANDQDQARDDLQLAKKLIAANPTLRQWLNDEKRNVIDRRDGRGFLEILPADASGSHGKTFRFVGFDEIHAYRSWDLLEALALDPSRPDAQWWITSYASLVHRPGAPLYDLMQIGKAGADPRMLFSWYAADHCTDPEFADLSPEQRANPSMASWGDPDYLAQQERRLPSHMFRRLHLNLAGAAQGAAYQPEMVMDAVPRGVSVRPPDATVQYTAFVDMSGGSSDDATLAIAHRDADGHGVLDVVMNQGQRPPFDPRLAVDRFAAVLREYRIVALTGDRYAGETFKCDFARHAMRYAVAEKPKSALYESLEPLLNGRRVMLLDVPTLEQQLIGLRWAGGKIDHPVGEHDDYANAVAGAVVSAVASRPARDPALIALAFGPSGRGTRVARPA